MRFSKILAMLCLSLPAIGFAESDTQINSNVVSTEINADTTIKKGCFSAFGPNRRRGPTGPRGPRGPAGATGATGATGGSFASSTVSLYIDTGGGALNVTAGSVLPQFSVNAQPVGPNQYNVVTNTNPGDAVYLDINSGELTLNAAGNFLVSYQAYPNTSLTDTGNPFTQLYLQLAGNIVFNSVTAVQGYSANPASLLTNSLTCVVTNTVAGSTLELISSEDFVLNNPSSFSSFSS